MKLNELSPVVGSTKQRKRVGRGTGSKTGTTAGRGNKGQKARSGGKEFRHGFEGGQMPLHRRLPKRGFKNILRAKIAIINLTLLTKKFKANDIVNPVEIFKSGLVKGNCDSIKILSEGEILFPLTIQDCLISQKAKDKIEKAGGKVES